MVVQQHFSKAVVYSLLLCVATGFAGYRLGQGSYRYLFNCSIVASPNNKLDAVLDWQAANEFEEEATVLVGVKGHRAYSSDIVPVTSVIGIRLGQIYRAKPPLVSTTWVNDNKINVYVHGGAITAKRQNVAVNGRAVAVELQVDKDVADLSQQALTH